MRYSKNFLSLVKDVGQTTLHLHQDVLIRHARANLSDIKKSIKQLPALNAEKQKSAIVISSGPSVHRQKSIPRIKKAGYQGTIIVADGAYLVCLKEGLVPDFVLTLDPHPKRMVRFFGDKDLEKNFENDDYLQRQDLDVEFRRINAQENQYHIQLVNQHAQFTKAVVASTTPRNVVERLKEAKFDIYWWNPLVDDPHPANSLTRQLYEMNRLPCLNTGGTVGTAEWLFASTLLKIPCIGLVGMDFGYYSDTPKENTQTYFELVEHLNGRMNLDDCFMEFEFPLTRQKFYTDPTYFWYRRNFFDLAKKVSAKTYNCTEGGTLVGDGIECLRLEEFFKLAENLHRA